MTRLLCPDGCEDEEGNPNTFMNVQTLRMHLLHRQGDGVHPQRTDSEIEALIFNPKLLPNNSPPEKPSGKSSISIKKK